MPLTPDPLLYLYWENWITNFIGEGPESHSISGSGNELDLGPTLGTIPGQHHFDPKAWGDRVPYKDPSLPFLTGPDHTWKHKEWSDFLQRRTNKRYQSQSGEKWKHDYTAVERKHLMDDFLNRKGVRSPS